MNTAWQETLQHSKYEKQGFIISFCGTDSDGKDIFQAQRIDDPSSWDDCGFTPPLLKDDFEAKKLAIKEGFVFENSDDPLRVTGKLIV